MGDRRGRAHAHRAGGQHPAGPRAAGALERGAGAPGGGALRPSRAPGGRSAAGARDPRAAGRDGMTGTAFGSQWLGALLSDREVAARLGDDRQLADMLAVERAWTDA